MDGGCGIQGTMCDLGGMVTIWLILFWTPSVVLSFGTEVPVLK